MTEEEYVKREQEIEGIIQDNRETFALISRLMVKWNELASHPHMAGCQSTNHTECYGDLWTCEACGKVVCEAEGTTDHQELCDDCWTARFAGADDEQVMIACPKCGVEQADFDGFGVVHCRACGYCTHPSASGGVCDICGAPVVEAVLPADEYNYTLSDFLFEVDREDRVFGRG